MLPLGVGPTLVPLLERVVRVEKPFEGTVLPVLALGFGGVFVPVPGLDG